MLSFTLRSPLMRFSTWFVKSVAYETNVLINPIKVIPNSTSEVLSHVEITTFVVITEYKNAAKS